MGDEFQAVYTDLRSALRATLLLRLSLPDGLDCRFGIGLGDVVVVGRSDYGLTQDGSAWWSAREAIEEAKRRETRRNKTLRTWFVAADPATVDAGVVNAALLARDGS
ncbi:SatD family protein [Aeromicrobium sp. UC242_57]|uniref:SatD family protein n=1 Tax=Aeromicrobium sp. UC242_57 TaxID=3374624 RepID=UPI0037B7D955